MFKFKVEAFKSMDDQSIIKVEYVNGTYKDAKKVMIKFWREGLCSNIKDVK